MARKPASAGNSGRLVIKPTDAGGPLIRALRYAIIRYSLLRGVEKRKIKIGRFKNTVLGEPKRRQPQLIM